METSSVVVGLVACDRLRVHRDFLARRGWTVATVPAPCDVLVACGDHLDDPAVAAFGVAFDGPALVLGKPAPSGWARAESLALPLLPLDLERRLRELTTDPSARGGGPRSVVLVVDDDPVVAQALARSLDDAGLEARTCQGWVDLAEALQDKPDFILMDLNLPGLTGEKMGGILRSRGIPTAIFSAESAERLREAQRSIGAVDAFPKGMPLHEVADRVAGHLRAARLAVTR
jgi:CheY-like chemotaxis protein